MNVTAFNPVEPGLISQRFGHRFAFWFQFFENLFQITLNHPDR
jgi:hypothetical protein